MKITKKFLKIANQAKFNGWPLVGEYRLGTKIPFFGQTLDYDLATPTGIQDYHSILRYFGWSVVFGVTTENKVITIIQWKPGTNMANWELSPGGIGKISPEATQEEITEKTKSSFLKETGYGDGIFKYLGHVIIESGKYRGAGPNDHGLPAHLFLATGLIKKQKARNPEPNEIIEILEVPIEEFLEVLNSELFVETSAVACSYKALIQLRLLKK
ncbi:MAG: hypothetical protein WC264_02635 [Candidatus Paceibacterota bacterium]|jgi:ADP-ribose pyrophosphatase